MAIAALVLFADMVLLTAVSALLQRRRTGDWGNRQTLLPRGSLEWWGLAVADLGYLLVGVGAPVAELVGLPALAIGDHPIGRGLADRGRRDRAHRAGDHRPVPAGP